MGWNTKGRFFEILSLRWSVLIPSVYVDFETQMSSCWIRTCCLSYCLRRYWFCNNCCVKISHLCNHFGNALEERPKSQARKGFLKHCKGRVIRLKSIVLFFRLLSMWLYIVDVQTSVKYDYLMYKYIILNENPIPGQMLSNKATLSKYFLEQYYEVYSNVRKEIK